MEALKNWLLLAALVAVAFLTFEVLQTERPTERQGARSPAPAAREAGASTPPPAPVQTSAPVSPEAPSVELQAAKGERDRYREGLEKCVEALNATSNTATQRREVRAFIVPVVPRAQPEAAALAEIVPLSDPWVIPSNGQVLVSGKIYNLGSAPGEVTVAVTLSRNGRYYDFGQQRLTAGAGQTVAWEQAFRGAGEDASWTVKVEIEP
jgi:hypothetical protein